MSEVEELRAEVERLRAHEVANGCIPRPVYEHLAKVAREQADALDRVEALADDHQQPGAWIAQPDGSHKWMTQLRAALDGYRIVWRPLPDGYVLEPLVTLADPVTGDTEDASPTAVDVERDPTFFRDKVTGEPCPRRGNVLCTLPYSPDHLHVAAHMWDAGAASPTEGSEIPTPEASGAGSIEQATEGGAK